MVRSASCGLLSAAARCSLVFIAASAIGCGAGEQGLSLSVDSRELLADGVSVVELSAEVVFRGEAVLDGEDVVFHCSQPLLFESREATVPEVHNGRNSGSTRVEVETSGGQARAYLQAPLSAGSVVVEASYVNANQETSSDSVRLEVAEPPLISGGAGTSGGVEEHFGISCEQANIGALIRERDPIRVRCSLVLKNASGRDLPHTPVRFYVEAGQMLDIPAERESARQFVYEVGPSPVTLPRDVTPWQAERDEDLVANSADPDFNEHNPRDGVVTILAVVRGHEAFHDANGNGVFDEGIETFIDEGEPFLDVDDDGVYDPLADPPPCCDSNENGSVDGPNGVWDSDVWIGRMTHIVWSGGLDPECSYLVPSPVTIQPEGSQTFSLRACDINGNPLAAVDVDDNMTLDSSSSKIGLTPTELEQGVPIGNAAGMFFNDRFPRFRFGWGDAASNPVFEGLSQPNGLLEGREWTFTVADARRPDSSTICSQSAWTVAATLEHTIATDHNGGNFDQRRAQLSASGTLEAKVGDPCP